VRFNYRISLWNYFHYNRPGPLERVIGEIREAGYGVEIWPGWFDEDNLFDPIHRNRLRLLIGDMESSIHGGGPDTIERHRLQIETAADTGCDVIVVHAGQMRLGGEDPDYQFAQSVLEMASANGVEITLENGPLPILLRALENLDGLGICLDVGHVYFTDDPMKAFVDGLDRSIRHLHIQDTLGALDHYVPGTGIIPEADWHYLLDRLEALEFNGAAVLEIRPRRPLQHAEQTKLFFEKLASGRPAASDHLK
jgi:sugar phosphate isomerase/epimerase